MVKVLTESNSGDKLDNAIELLRRISIDANNVTSVDKVVSNIRNGSNTMQHALKSLSHNHSSQDVRRDVYSGIEVIESGISQINNLIRELEYLKDEATAAAVDSIRIIDALDNSK